MLSSLQKQVNIKKPIQMEVDIPEGGINKRDELKKVVAGGQTDGTDSVVSISRRFQKLNIKRHKGPHHVVKTIVMLKDKHEKLKESCGKIVLGTSKPCHHSEVMRMIRPRASREMGLLPSPSTKRVQKDDGGMIELLNRRIRKSLVISKEVDMHAGLMNCENESPEIESPSDSTYKTAGFIQKSWKVSEQKLAERRNMQDIPGRRISRRRQSIDCIASAMKIIEREKKEYERRNIMI